MMRNDLYPYYPRTMQTPVNLFHCSGPEGAMEIRLPPESTAAIFDDQIDRVYIVTNEGEVTGRSRIRHSFDLVKIPTPTDNVTRAEFDELRKAMEDVQHAISESINKPRTGNEAGTANGK